MSCGSCWRQEIDLGVPFFIKTNTGSLTTSVFTSARFVFKCPVNLEEASIPTAAVDWRNGDNFFKLIIISAHQMNLTDLHLIHLVVYYNPEFHSRIHLSLGVGWFMNHQEEHCRNEDPFPAFSQPSNWLKILDLCMCVTWITVIKINAIICCN